jgi:hypothetical protein
MIRVIVSLQRFTRLASSKSESACYQDLFCVTDNPGDVKGLMSSPTKSLRHCPFIQYFYLYLVLLSAKFLACLKITCIL